MSKLKKWLVHMYENTDEKCVASKLVKYCNYDKDNIKKEIEKLRIKGIKKSCLSVLIGIFPVLIASYLTHFINFLVGVIPIHIGVPIIVYNLMSPFGILFDKKEFQHKMDKLMKNHNNSLKKLPKKTCEDTKRNVESNSKTKTPSYRFVPGGSLGNGDETKTGENTISVPILYDPKSHGYVRRKRPKSYS